MRDVEEEAAPTALACVRGEHKGEQRARAEDEECRLEHAAACCTMAGCGRVQCSRADGAR